jgi:hypothetical protein
MEKEILYKFSEDRIDSYRFPGFELKIGDWYNLIIPKDMLNGLQFEEVLRNKKNFLVDKEKYLIDLNEEIIKYRSFGLTQHYLDILNKSISQGKKILIFNTNGLDIMGVEKFYSEVDKNIDRIAIIELFYPINVDTKVFSYVKVLDIDGTSFKEGIVQAATQRRFHLDK